MKKNKWWQEGIQFSCQGSGKCCVSRGAYGFVYLTLQDRQALAKHLKVPTATFTKKYCDRDSNGFWKLNDFTDSCQFMKGTKCEVYKARPTQCRTWPFWPENMGAKAWAKEVKAFCPGVGKGKVWTASEIEKTLKVQAKSEDQY
jgi:Fe-S-cluster containining protein